jgi:hypothetical protein
MLQVVQHEQQLPALAQAVPELWERLAFGHDAHRQQRRFGELLGVREARQRRPAHGVVRRPASGDLQREARLAHPAQPQQREAARVGLTQRTQQLLQLLFPPQKGRRRGRQCALGRLDGNGERGRRVPFGLIGARGACLPPASPADAARTLAVQQRNARLVGNCAPLLAHILRMPRFAELMRRVLQPLFQVEHRQRVQRVRVIRLRAHQPLEPLDGGHALPMLQV